MIDLSVKGMTCQHCVANVKKSLEAVEGVTLADVNLENNNAIVNGSAAKDALIKAVVDAGFEAS